jgi:hypothetical protein
MGAFLMGDEFVVRQPPTPMDKLRTEGVIHQPFESPATGNFLQTILTLNPNIPITVMRVGELLVIRMDDHDQTIEG